jgi:hypothetical protein
LIHAGRFSGAAEVAELPGPLPLTSVLLATLLLASDGLAVMPLVIVAVVLAYELSVRLTPAPRSPPQPEQAPRAPAADAAAPPARSA